MGYVSKTTSDGRFVRVKDYKKRIRRNRLKRRILFFAFLLFCVVLFFHLAPIFNVKEIRCTESGIVSKEEIITASTISYDYNIFRTSLKKAKKKIESIPYIENAVIKRKFPNIIEIKVTECEVCACVPLNEGYIYIDKECKMLEYSNVAKEGLPIVHSTGAITFEAGNKLQCDVVEKTDVLKELFKSLSENNLLGLINLVDIPDIDRITVFYEYSLEV
ncbi:MAG: FtsQ-type POTRA domain-containing protein [Clostridiaceae bacterium]|nr:FtsQ-type POTRA domain-containing protein [Clostridiaceae bacterium]